MYRTIPYLLISMLCMSLYGCTLKSESAAETDSNDDITNIDTLSYSNKLTKIANGDTTGRWPVSPQPFPSGDPILPFKRIVAYYGNLYSKKMGILGEYPPQEVWKRLHAEMKVWEKADPSTPVQPAIHYIAAVPRGVLRKTAPTANVCPKVRLIPPYQLPPWEKPLYFWTYRWL